MKKVFDGMAEKSYAVYDDESQGIFLDHADCFHLALMFNSPDAITGATMVAEWINKYMSMYSEIEGK